MPQTVGPVIGLALKTGKRQPLRAVDEATAIVGAGVEDVVTPKTRRGVTFLSSQQWAQVMEELDADLPWTTRRANVLVDTGAMADLIGKTVRVGEAKLVIHDETKPCWLMDEYHDGLQDALVPDCRGGVFGEVVEGGTIRVGDELTVE